MKPSGLLPLLAVCLFSDPAHCAIHRVVVRPDVVSPSKLRQLAVMDAKRKVHGNIPKNSDYTPDSAALSLRGGDLGSVVRGETLARVFTGLCAYVAIAASTFAVPALSKLGTSIAKNGFEHYSLSTGVAMSATCLAITSYLANIRGTSVEVAIGAGYAARLLFVARILLTGRHEELEMPFFTIGGVLLAAVGTILSGGRKAALAAKALSLAAVLHGAAVIFDPAGAFSAMGRDIADAVPVTKSVAQMDGTFMLASGLYSGLLASGFNSVKAAGFAQMGMLPLFWVNRNMIGAEKVLGLSVNAWVAIKLPLSCAMIAGMILPNGVQE